MARTRWEAGVVLVFVVALVLILAAQDAWSFGQGPNNRNVSIDTTVNITSSPPTVASVKLYTGNITLGAGVPTVISCNATISEYNGWSDVNAVNATLFLSTSSEGAADDNNTHYTNASCQQISNDGNYLVNYTCNFTVQYYATNGVWNCSVHVNNSMGFQGAGWGLANISPLYALNVTTNIDYGNVGSGQYSNNQTANITNLGNTKINITVRGYGQTENDGLSFKCDQGNLSVNLQHFAANSTANFLQKQALSGSSQSVYGLSVVKTTTGAPSTNSTYWELYADPTQAAYGRCNGTIVFQAESA